MIIYIERRHKNFAYRILSAFIAFTFSFTSVIPPSYAQTIGALNLPVPGAMVTLSPAFVPILLKGMTIHPDNPLQFDFIIDSGNTNFKEDQIKSESERLVKYFLASMTIPKDDLWVNLSPYESDKIVPEELGKTELGRDMLAQDYILKQLTASLMYPEKELGKEFWDKVYKTAQEKYGTTEIPVNTFNKVWILPETATVYEHGQTVYIVEAKLRVMLDSDYVAQKLDSRSSTLDTRGPSSIEHPASSIETSIIKEVILPEIEREVNEGQNFAPLRQIYHSLILAKWYKETIKNSLLSKIYVDQKKIAGVDTDDPTLKDQIYAQYMEAYKKGVFNYIKEDYDRLSNETIPRKYFSGGIDRLTNFNLITLTKTEDTGKVVSAKVGTNFELTVKANPQKEETQSDSPVSIFDERISIIPQGLPERRDFYASQYDDLYTALADQYKKQAKAGRQDQAGKWESFFKIIEYGNTVGYALFYPHQNEAALFSKEVPKQELEKADIVFVQNVARAARPARPGKEKQQVDPENSRMTVLVPKNVIKDQPDELYLEWRGPSGHPWWIMFNPFAIWPQKDDTAANDQPFHVTVSRADGRIYQKEMNKQENIEDVLSLFVELNNAARSKAAEAFRVAVNGWYYSDAPDAPKAGASQSQAHAQILRFIFPIEHAKLERKGHAGPIQISTIADGLGTGIVLEAQSGNEDDLVKLTAQTLKLITDKGHSFNILITPGAAGMIRVFVADKIKGTPEQHFTNEWAFAEFGRAIVVDDPATFYGLSPAQKKQYDSFDTATSDGKAGMVRWTEEEKKADRLTDINPSLRENALAALKIVTAPQEEIDAIVKVLSGQPAEAEKLLWFFENDENKLRAEMDKWINEYKEKMGVLVSDSQILEGEFLRLTDENGRYAGGIMPRDLAHAKKQWHRTVGAFLIDRQGNVLFQKRAADKAIKPGAYDVSVGGHAGLDDPRTAIAREIEEEIFDGTHSIDLSRLFPLTADNEFVKNEEGKENASFFAYVLEEDEKEKIKKQDKELDALEWLGTEALDNLLQGYRGYAQDSDDPYAAGFLFFENETRKEALLDLARRLRDGESIQDASSPIVLARDIESAEELIVQQNYEKALKIYKKAQAAVGTLSKKEVKKDDEAAEKKGEKIIRYLRELKEDIDERISGLELAIAFEKNVLTEERIKGLSSYQMVALLRILPLAEFSIPQKFILYSGAPGSGKGTLMEQTFDKKARFGDIVGQLLLYHTRPARKGELDGKKYHFRLISVLKTLEQIGRIKMTAVNKQQQGVADEEFEEEVVVRPNVPSEALLRGDIVIKQGDKDLSEKEQWEVEDKQMAVKEVTVVKRRIKGMKEAFGTDKITVMEGGYGWFLVLTKDPRYADIFTVFITPFEDDEIILRGKNQEIISATFARPFDRFIAYSQMNIMRLERGKEKLDLQDPETLGELRGKVDQWLQTWGAQESSLEMMRSLKRHETDEKPALKNNAVLIESDEFIEQLNRSLKKYFGKADEDLIKTDQQKALARALAYEVQMKLGGDVARGDTSFYLEIPTSQSEENGVFTKPEDMFNRVVEGVIQIMFRKEYYAGTRAGKGLVVRNKFVYDKDKIKEEIAKMAGDFSTAYFAYLLTAMVKEKGERDKSSTLVGVSDQNVASDQVGGIDMNSIGLDRQGAGVEIQFDPAQLQEIIDLGIDGFAPVIINITPLPSVLPLLGLDPANKEEELEVSVL